MFKKNKGILSQSQKGFTLIELLVVIAIIGILSSVVLVSLQSSRAKARDAKRIADIGGIQQALALYYDSNNQYPNTLGGATDSLVSAGLLPSEPKGPNNNETYMYAPASDNLSYHLGATLEQVTAGTGVLATDKDCATNAAATTGFCPGFTAGVTGDVNTGVDPIYDVTP